MGVGMSVSIDNDFARFGAKSYAINKITSVEVREMQSKNGGCAIAILGFITVVMLLASITFPPFLIFVLMFGAGTWYAWKLSKRVTYQLFLITSASEQQAYENRDPQDVYRLRDQVEAAMLHHSRGGRS